MQKETKQMGKINHHILMDKTPPLHIALVFIDMLVKLNITTRNPPCQTTVLIRIHERI